MKTENKKIKIIVISAVSILLALAVFLTCFALFSKKTVMKYDSYRITEDMYQYWLSDYKQKILRDYPDVRDSEAFWTSPTATGISYEEHFTNIIDVYVKRKLSASVLFDSLGYKLSSEARTEIENILTENIEYVSGGDKEKFETVLSKYGIDYNGYKNTLIYDYKELYLYSLLYGSGSSGVSAEELNEFFNAFYFRVKIIIIRTDFDYERNSDSSPKTDENGEYIKKYYTEAESKEKKDKISEMKALTDAGKMNEEDFEQYYNVDNRDWNAGAYPNGYYLSSYSEYDKQIKNLVFGMNINEIKYLDFDGYTCFIKRYANVENDYSSDEYKDSEWFDNFYSNAAQYIYYKLLDSYAENITVYPNVKGKFLLRNVKANKDI